MEGMGARLGRSSTRYGGPAAVFTGPVRKWKKKWVPLSNPNPTNNSNNNHNHNHNSSSNNNNNNSSHLVLYKWTPISNSKDSPPIEEPPPKRFRYIPVAALEKQKQEEEEEEEEDAAAAADVKTDDEGKTGDGDDVASEAPTEADGGEEKTDVIGSDVKDEAQVSDKDEAPADDANGTSLDLNLGLKARDGDSGSDPKMEEQDEGSNDQVKR